MKKTCLQTSGQKGFTLLEVMIAITIFAIGLLAMAHAIRDVLPVVPILDSKMNVPARIMHVGTCNFCPSSRAHKFKPRDPLLVRLQGK